MSIPSIWTRALDVFAVVVVSDLARYQHWHLLGCRSCRAHIDYDDKFCRKCGTADPQHVPPRDPAERYRVQVRRTGHECYPPMYRGPSPDDAIKAALDEFHKKES